MVGTPPRMNGWRGVCTLGMLHSTTEHHIRSFNDAQQATYISVHIHASTQRLKQRYLPLDAPFSHVASFSFDCGFCFVPPNLYDLF